MPQQQFIPAYPYWQYQDDPNIGALFTAYNQMGQAYLDWFNQTPLPVYTAAAISGLLLDWVAMGLYGMARPALPATQPVNIGAYDTWMFGQVAYGAYRQVGPSQSYVTTDDVFKRILTWHFFKGDGKYFTIRWLKRRVMRFLIGAQGTAPPIDQTYRISVSFAGRQCNIGIRDSSTMVQGGALFNGFAFGAGVPFGSIKTNTISFTPFPFAPIFKAAVLAGALELPFQFTYEVNV